MVKALIFLSLLLLNLSAYSIEGDIVSIIGKESYHTNRGLIAVLFKDKRKFLRESDLRADLPKITKMLKDNNLLDLKFGRVSDFELSFATHQKNTMLFIKIIKEVLSLAGYSTTFTKKALKDSSGFLWSLQLHGADMIDPYLITTKLEELGAVVNKIKRKSKYSYRYEIDITNAHIKAIVPRFGEVMKLKKSLNDYWIDVYGANLITIVSLGGNSWHPYVVFYDKNLNALSNYTKERKSYNITLKIPKGAKYIKISDLYTIVNIKRGMNITVRK